MNLLWLRSLIIFLIFCGVTIVCTLLLFITDLLRIKFKSKIPSIWSKIYLKMCSIKVVVHNQQAQPIEGCLYLYNHCSNIDPLVVQSAVAKPVRMGAKKELFKVPVLGRGMLLGGTLPIDRTNREAVLNSYRNIYKDVQAGDNFALAPEGTRQPQEFPFGNFKLGPFTFAIEAQVPIVPLVIVGSSKVWGKKQLLPATNSFKNKIDVIVCKPLKPDEFKGLDNIALSEKVKLLMSTAYTEFVKGS